MAITRAQQLESGKAEIYRQIHKLVKDKFADGEWHHLKSNLKVMRRVYQIEVDFKIQEGIISFENEKFQLLDDRIIIH